MAWAESWSFFVKKRIWSKKVTILPVKDWNELTALCRQFKNEGIRMSGIGDAIAHDQQVAPSIRDNLESNLPIEKSDAAFRILTTIVGGRISRVRAGALVSS